MQAPPLRDAPLLSLAFCLAAGALARFGLMTGHDLRGAFGPDAPGAAASAFGGILAHPYPLHPLLIRLLALPGGDPVQASLLLSLCAGLATVAAAWSLGRVLTDGRDGRSTALLAAAAPLLVQQSLLRGGDALAMAMASWGLALAWWGAWELGGPTPRRSARIALVVGPLLLGLSAAAKPVALPLGALLLLAPMLGGRRSLPWLAAGLVGGALLALPFLGPLLRPRPSMGLLGSWWLPGVPGMAELPARVGAAFAVSLGLLREQSWSQLAPILLLAGLGCSVSAPRRGFRLAVLAVGLASVLALGLMLGDRLQVRYLGAASFGLLLLAGVALTPAALRAPRAARPPSWRAVLMGPLPLSLAITLFVMANLRLWDGLALLRAQEEGTAAPEGFFADWAGAWRPTEAYADSSVCGALELEALAAGLAQRLPRGSTVVTLPLRDGRGWHLLGPLAVARDDLTLLELGPECCSSGPERCAAALPGALAAAGGGALVLPLLPEGRCETGALPSGLEPWRAALMPLIDEGGTWYGGWVRAASPPPHQHLCEGLGGRAPVAPARI